jgi:hypothetical protein
MKKASVISALARGLSLALALLAAGTCLVTGRASAQGTIVHVVPPQPIPYSDYPSSQGIDLNGDGIVDFNLSSPNGIEIELAPLNNNAIISVPEPPGELGAWIYAFSQDAPISSSLDPVLVWWGSDGNATPDIVAASNLGALGYFAYRTDPTYARIQLDVSGALYYGWIHIQNLGGSNWGQISDWAYETSPNTPIFAGAVPEPGTVSLCAIGTMMVLLFRSKPKPFRF